MDTKILDVAHDDLRAGQVRQPLARVHAWLRDQRRFLTPAQWHEVRSYTSGHPVAELLRTDPLIGRGYLKPRGYAGDAVIMDMIYGLDPDAPAGQGFAAELFGYATGIASFRAVRYRRMMFRSLVDQVSERTPGIDVASVGAGHLREAEDSIGLREGRVNRCLAFDQDRESLAVIERDYAKYGVVPEHKHIREIITDGRLPGKVHLVHAGGLYDYLTDRTAIPLTRSLIASLEPGGTLLVANIVPTSPDIAFLEAVMDWPLVHRDEQDMRRLLDEVPAGRLDTVTLHRDPDDVMSFLTVTVS